METISNGALAAARAKLDAAESRRENILLFYIANGVNIESRTVQIDDGVVIAPGAPFWRAPSCAARRSSAQAASSAPIP